MKTPENAPDNNVGSKTPEEIKKGLVCCASKDDCVGVCPYEGINLCRDFLMKHAKGLIEQLESRLAQAERERDAAVADIRNAKWMLCHVCKNYYRPDPAIRHYACKAFGEFSEFLNPSDFAEDGYGFPSLCGKFEWRGVCPENTKEATQ